ncbi:MAG TPA: Crp/Fnr family transcriptional regulator [Acidobacteriaceae bacterium]|nr:Crp/Fnr family transcriptional regulator [Acidobacteriaceae bacterium]
MFEHLPDRDWARWSEKLEFVHLPRGMVLQETNRPRNYVWFPATAVVSLLCGLTSGESTQIALIGNEGFVGMALVLGALANPTHAVVSAGGHGYRMRAADIQAEFGELAVMQVLLRYSLALTTQISQGAVCNRHHLLEQQLCRWLLCMLDRQTGEEIRGTHEELSQLLGCRRESVSELTSKLEQAGLVRHSRGRIQVLDRAGLEARSCECHAVVEREYHRLMGPPPRGVT